jgi:hypothetical protein
MNEHVISFLYQGVAIKGVVVHQEGKTYLVRVTWSADKNVVRPGHLVTYEPYEVYA